jgi:hypothetical protein
MCRVDLQGLLAEGGPVLASKTLQDRRALVDISAMSHISLTLAFSVIINEPTFVRACETHEVIITSSSRHHFSEMVIMKK